MTEQKSVLPTKFMKIVETIINSPKEHVDLIVNNIISISKIRKSYKDTENAFNDVLSEPSFNNFYNFVGSTFNLTGQSLRTGKENINFMAYNLVITNDLFISLWETWKNKKSNENIVNFLIKPQMIETLTELSTSENFANKISNTINAFFESKNKKIILDEIGLNITSEETDKLQKVTLTIAPAIINFITYFKGNENLIQELSDKYFKKVSINNKNQNNANKEFSDQSLKCLNHALKKGMLQDILKINEILTTENMSTLLQTKRVQKIKNDVASFLQIEKIDNQSIIDNLPLLQKIMQKMSEKPKNIQNLSQSIYNILTMKQNIKIYEEKINDIQELKNKILEMKRLKQHNDKSLKSSLAAVIEPIVNDPELRSDMSKFIETNKDIIVKSIDIFLDKEKKFKNLTESIKLDSNKIYDFIKSGASTEEGMQSIIDYLNEPNNFYKKARMIAKTQNIVKALKLTPMIIWSYFTGNIKNFKEHSIKPMKEKVRFLQHSSTRSM